MRRTLLFSMAVVIVASFIVPLAHAGNGKYGRYFGLRFIGSVAEVQDTKATNFSGNLQINNDEDLAAGNSLMFGYRWKSLPIRTEIEVGVRYRFDYDLRDTGSQTGYENNLLTVAGLVNVAYEYRSNSSFTPYFGASIGWANQRSDIRRNNLITLEVEEFSGDKHNLAWGGLLGMTWQFAKHWDTDFGYRYINLGGVDTGISSIGSRIEADDYVSHDVLVTFNYRF